MRETECEEDLGRRKEEREDRWKWWEERRLMETE